MDCEQRAIQVLDQVLPLTEATIPPRRIAAFERRAKPRSTQTLPARVWGVDIDDHPFSFDCVLDNISASGLYLRMPRRMRFSSAISLVVRLLHGPLEGMSAAIKGSVIRDQLEPDGRRGVAVRIIEHRFL